MAKSTSEEALAPGRAGLNRHQGENSQKSEDAGERVWKGRQPGHPVTQERAGRNRNPKKHPHCSYVKGYYVEKEYIGFVLSSGQNMDQLIQMNIKIIF